MCYGLSAETVATAQLLVSELVTNAVVHGKAPIGLRISRDEGMVRVEISDARAQTPQLIRPLPDPQAEAGRGLFLLDALASAWGTIPAGRHGPKTTWFELN
jgi:anti-sigma regulatory factor (Ser/Thr protein kinase)